MSFDASARTVTGTPSAAAASATYTYTAAATDYTSATLTFSIVVAEPTPAELSFGDASIADQSYTKDAAIDTLTLPQATGGSGTITYSLSKSLPAGLSFDATARTITGTPTSVAAESTYRYTATDGTDTVMLSFKIEVTAAEEQASTASWSGTVPDFSWTKGTAVSVTLPSYTGATGYEIRGPEHTNHVKALPAGLTFDASARTITGTPTEHFQGELYVWLAKASPPQEEEFRIRVANDDGNHPPERSFSSNVDSQIIPVNPSHHRAIYCSGSGNNDVLYVPGGSHSSFFVDPDGDTLTYTVSSSHPKVISVTTATHSGATVIKEPRGIRVRGRSRSQSRQPTPTGSARTCNLP